MLADLLTYSPEVAQARREGRPIVALESTLITHGLPYPINLKTALGAEAAIRDHGACPATIAIIGGIPRVGLTEREIEWLAQCPEPIAKASRRDLPGALALGQHAGTTVSATMMIAQGAGIAVFATGGIGGVHRGAEQSFDISADLIELSRTPIAVVCAGAKSILDLPKTIELLETLGVPVLGYRTSFFPAFYGEPTKLPISQRLDNVSELAKVIAMQRAISTTGCLICQTLRDEMIIPTELFETTLREAEQKAIAQGIHGAASTPFLLKEIAQGLGEPALVANQELVLANARLGAQVAVELGR